MNDINAHVHIFTMYLFYLRMYGYNQIRGREEITLTFKQKVFVFESWML